MLEWNDFIDRHSSPHLVLGRTRNLSRWRDNTFLRLIDVQKPSGRFSFKRDLDEERGRYLILVGFEKEVDAVEFGQALGASRDCKARGRYASRRVFKLGAESKALKRAKKKNQNG